MRIGKMGIGGLAAATLLAASASDDHLLPRDASAQPSKIKNKPKSMVIRDDESHVLKAKLKRERKALKRKQQQSI